MKVKIKGNSKMKYAQIRKFDVTNGPKVRTTLFVSGCTHNCPECFNKDQQSFQYGELWTEEVEEQFLSYVKNPNVHGVSILGGEPMQQLMDDSLLKLLTRIKEETNKEIWLWSGYTYDEIISNPRRKEILEQVDVLIDGPFKAEMKNLSLKYRGSENQRVIDVKKSLQENKVVLINAIPILMPFFYQFLAIETFR